MISKNKAIKFPRVDHKSSNTFTIKLFSPYVLAFPTGDDLQGGFINKLSTEFRSILRAPQANKNAQEQFENVQYLYTFTFTNQENYLRALKKLKKHPAFIVATCNHINAFQTHF